MRILYVGDLVYGSTSLDRLQALEELGFDIIPFNIRPFFDAAHRIIRSIGWRFQRGPVVRNLNASLLEQARSLTADILWIDKGIWILPETLAEAKRLIGADIAVHYTPDPQFRYHSAHLFLEGAQYYDLCVTTKPYELADYAAIGARDTLLVLQGYRAGFDPSLKHLPEAESLRADIQFIGHYEKHYARQLKPLSDLDVTFAVHGSKWKRYSRLHPWAKRCVKSDGVWGQHYAIALASSKIGIGLLSKTNADTTTTRTFEIPASGAMLLAERTEEHCDLFDEGTEAEFFGSSEELVEKVERYLRDDTKRGALCEAGRRRCIASGYDTVTQIKRVLTHLNIN